MDVKKKKQQDTRQQLEKHFEKNHVLAYFYSWRKLSSMLTHAPRPAAAEFMHRCGFISVAACTQPQG